MRIARHAGTVLAITGLLLVGYSLYEGFSGRIYQVWRGRELDRKLDTLPPAPATPRAPGITYEKGSAIGRLEIPRIGLSVVVLEGSDQGTLRLGAGRVRNSSLPGEPGNLVVAAHRDTFFRPLREIRPGDQISLRTAEGTFAYTVDWTKVVKPADVSVIMPTSSPALTLVTCYPFYYIGSAPERFIVRALPTSTVNAVTPVANSGKPSPFAAGKPSVTRPVQSQASVPVVRTAIAAPTETVTSVVIRPAVAEAPVPVARPAIPATPPPDPERPAIVPTAAAQVAAPAAAPSPADPDAPAQRRKGPVKRAFHKIARVFSSHRDKLQ